MSNAHPAGIRYRKLEQLLILMKPLSSKEEIKLTRLEILHHGLLYFFMIISFIATSAIWSSIELLFGFESRLMGHVFFWLNFGFIVVVTNRIFISLKLRFKYIGILFVVLLFCIPFAVKYAFEINT